MNRIPYRLSPFLRMRLNYTTMSDSKNPLSPLFISPLWEFFERGVPLPDPTSEKFATFGRSWSASELRLKSFEDLHKLWFICLKELNLLSTQENFAQRKSKPWYGVPRIFKTKLTMKRIRQVIRERRQKYEEAVGLWRRSKMGLPLELSQKEMDMAWAWRRVDNYRKKSRSFRKFLRHIRGGIHPQI